MNPHADATHFLRASSRTLGLGFALLLMGTFRAGVARGEVPLGQFVGNLGFGFTDGRPIGFTYLVLQVAPDPMGQVRLQPSLFENIRVSSAVIGHEYFETAATDSDFSAIAASLTNGVDEWVTVWHFQEPAIMGAGSGVSQHESQYLGAAGRPDLVGRRVTSVSLIVTNYRTERGLDYVDFTFAAYGVPEPTSASMGLGAMAAVVLRRRRSGGVSVQKYSLGARKARK